MSSSVTIKAWGVLLRLSNVRSCIPSAFGVCRCAIARNTVSIRGYRWELWECFSRRHFIATAEVVEEETLSYTWKPSWAYWEVTAVTSDCFRARYSSRGGGAYFSRCSFMILNSAVPGKQAVTPFHLPPLAPSPSSALHWLWCQAAMWFCTAELCQTKLAL